jgi:predicted oxidoreductase
MEKIMRKIKLGNSDLLASTVALGCWRTGEMAPENFAKLAHTALDCGVNFFDLADIYGRGKCEALLGEFFKTHPAARDQIIVQTKCGIRAGFFDFSTAHILAAVEGSLKRLNLEKIDVLLLHRPDALVEPDEVAAAFDKLQASGKVAQFGVSNHRASQIEFLQRGLRQKLLANQLQFGPAHTPLIDSGIALNMTWEQSLERDGATLDYCRLNHLTIQAWSPLGFGAFEGLFLNNEKFAALNAELESVGKKYGVDKTAAAVAWISRHPARIQTILGTTKPEHFVSACAGADIDITREEWYGIYKAAGNRVP